jgi:hypothetical protein
MADSILDAHEVIPGFFVISGPLEPISIRDQMVRGQWLIERLLEPKLIAQVGTNGPISNLPVAIIGAGAAGITAAITCASNHVKATVIERDLIPFARQAASTTRWLDPSQYDWPAGRWTTTAYPATGTAPLSYRAARSNVLAVRWSVEWQTALRRAPSLLQVKYGVWVTHIRPIYRPVSTVPSFDLTLSDGTKISAQALIWAAGFGLETCEIVEMFNPAKTVKFRGVPFWGSDALEQPKCGCATMNPRVALLGGGDGALQDALRALTKKKSARHLHGPKTAARLRARYPGGRGAGSSALDMGRPKWAPRPRNACGARSRPPSRSLERFVNSFGPTGRRIVGPSRKQRSSRLPPVQPCLVFLCPEPLPRPPVR